MSAAAIAPMDAESTRVRTLIRSFTPAEWELPSGCAGWRVQDVVVHLACVFHAIAEPGTIEQAGSDDAEVNAEAPVEARRHLAPEEVIAEYDTWAAAGTSALRGLQADGVGNTVVPLGNLGHQPLHLLANAVVFDHYCHLRHDIGATIDRAAELPRDPDALAATLEWMWAGLPQMCAPALATCDTGVNVVLEGPGGGAWAVRPGAELWTVEPGTDPGLPTARSTPHEFVSWGTRRCDWRASGVQLDDEVAAPTLDAINII
jgi:uncharacterized protein (TIGR03083 family)